jgi:peptidyl-prolyl cis-trans isomerase D
MLTQLRDKSQSFLIFVLFGMLIVVFIFFFGPQAEGIRPGGPQSNVGGWAVKIGDEEVTQREVEMAVRRQALFESDDLDEGELARLRRLTAEQVAARVALEQRARSMGMAVTDTELSSYIVGEDNPDAPLFRGREGAFEKDRYVSQVSQSLGGTTELYRKTKERELIIKRYMAFLESQVNVSEAEAREAFERSKRTWNLGFVVVDPADHAPEGAEPTAEEGTAYAKAHPDAVKAWFEANKKEYDREKEIRVRRILVRKPKDADEKALAEAKAKLEKLKARVEGGEDFEAVAKEASEGYYKSFGGDMGWQGKENTSPPDYAVYAALEQGQISDVKESPIGFWFVKAEEVKPAVHKKLDEVTDEIGLKLAKEDRRKGAARAVAEDILAQVKAGKTLEQAAPPLAPAPGGEEGEGAEGEGAEGEGESKAPESRVQTTGPFSANRPMAERIPGIGKSEALAARLNDLTEKSPLVDEVLEIEGKFYVVRLVERFEPSDEDFAKEKDNFLQRLRMARVNQLFGGWQQLLFGSVRQRDLLQRFGAGAAIASLTTLPETATINEEAYPPVPAAPAPVMPGLPQ